MDWYGDYPTGTQASPDIDPTGLESGSVRVVRGGGWLYLARYCRSARRDDFTPASRYADLGFRLSRTK